MGLVRNADAFGTELVILIVVIDTVFVAHADKHCLNPIRQSLKDCSWELTKQ